MALTVKGRIDQILPEQTGVSKAGKSWNKQDFVIDTDEQFPKKACFTLFSDKTTQLNGLKPGSEIEVSFNIESREFNGKWYTNLNAWLIKPAEGAQQPQFDAPSYSANDMPPPPPMEGGIVDDLPF